MEHFNAIMLILSLLSIESAMFIPVFESNKPVPVREESLILLCFPVAVFNFGNILWRHPSDTELSRCYSFGGGICNVNTTSYAFTANSTGSYAFIHSLNRTRDSGLWQCGYPDIGWLNQTVVVYASPVGVKLVPSLPPVTDLGMESLTLKCQTVNCTFPAPSITWYIYNMTSTHISPYTGSSSTLEPDTSLCTEQETVYTSTLQLPRGTTFPGNTLLTTKFLCGLEHPTLGQKVEYSQHSNNVTFAAVFIPILETNKPFPVGEESLILSCFPATIFNTGSIKWFHPNGTELSRCYPIGAGLCNVNTTSYAFTANSTGSFAFIHSLNRTRDSGLWQCAYPYIGWLNQTVVVYASPVGVKLVSSVSPVTNLGMESLILKCQTFKCTFPAPNITWYIYNMTSTHISPYTGSSSTLEPDTSLCTEQEAVYTSTLQLPRGTTFPGNTPLTTKFLCGLEHPTLGQKVEYSQQYSNVTFAAVFIPILETNKPFPVAEESLILSCFPATIFNTGSIKIKWFHPNGTELSRCYPIGAGLCNVNTTSYVFTANSTGSFAFIHSLNRTRDSGLWQCAYPYIGWLNQTVVVYASPVGVKLVSSVSPVTNLCMESLTLKCQTFKCTFPAPSITWYIYNMTSTHISPYTGSSSTLEPDTSLCTEQEAVYTSTLQLPRGTTFPGNVLLTMKFLCGLEHPTLGQKVEYSQHSNNVTFAVASTSESHGIPVAGIAGGIIAGFVISFGVVISMLLWRRYQHRKKNEHDNDAAKENEESTRRNQVQASYVKQNVASGKEYEGLHFTKAEATQYLQLNGLQKMIPMKNCTRIQTMTSRCIAH